MVKTISLGVLALIASTALWGVVIPVLAWGWNQNPEWYLALDFIGSVACGMLIGLWVYARLDDV